MSVIGNPLAPAEFYTETLEEVLGLRLFEQNAGEHKKLLGIARQVETLTHGLTTDRPRFLDKHYLSDRKLREAYQLYYTTTNLLKIIPPLRELALSGIFEHEQIDVLDLGTGTGAALWGLIQYFEQERKKPLDLRLYAVDAVGSNISDVERFHAKLAKRLTVIRSSLETQTANIVSPTFVRSVGKRFSLVLMMNALNELPDDSESNVLRSLEALMHDDSAAIIVEPASRVQSRRLLRLRDLAVHEGCTIYAPCTRQADCPALVREDDWCHSEYPWDRPPFIKAIDDEIGTLRLSLKSSYLTLTKRPVTLSTVLGGHDPIRVVSERFDEKGRTRLLGCGKDGRNEYVLNTRDKSDANRAILNAERYDLLDIEGEEVREHDRKITKASLVNIMLPNTGAR